MFNGKIHYFEWAILSNSQTVDMTRGYWMAKLHQPRGVKCSHCSNDALRRVPGRPHAAWTRPSEISGVCWNLHRQPENWIRRWPHVLGKPVCKHQISIILNHSKSTSCPQQIPNVWPVLRQILIFLMIIGPFCDGSGGDRKPHARC